MPDLILFHRDRSILDNSRDQTAKWWGNPGLRRSKLPARSADSTTSLVAIDLEACHRFHSYCVRFPSQVAETAISTLSKIGDSVSDPFCGSGTTLVAGLALGRTVVGSDIDVLAGMISEVKCSARSTRPWKHQDYV
jgi:DNA modification methylase